MHGYMRRKILDLSLHQVGETKQQTENHSMCDMLWRCGHRLTYKAIQVSVRFRLFSCGASSNSQDTAAWCWHLLMIDGVEMEDTVWIQDPRILVVGFSLAP